MAALNASGAEVMLADGVHRVKFDMNALIDVEDDFGSIEEVELAFTTKSLGTIRKMLFYGLAHEEVERSLEDIGDLMFGATNLIPPIRKAMLEALGQPNVENPTKAAANRSTRRATAKKKSSPSQA